MVPLISPVSFQLRFDIRSLTFLILTILEVKERLIFSKTFEIDRTNVLKKISVIEGIYCEYMKIMLYQWRTLTY